MTLKACLKVTLKTCLTLQLRYIDGTSLISYIAEIRTRKDLWLLWIIAVSFTKHANMLPPLGKYIVGLNFLKLNTVALNNQNNQMTRALERREDKRCGLRGYWMGDMGIKKLSQLGCSPSRRTWKINLQKNQKGYDKCETTYGKLSTRKIQICLVHFCGINFDLFFQNNFPNNA